jgi:hypothetical protein
MGKSTTTNLALGAVLAAGLTVALSAPPAVAGGAYCSDIQISCENGRTYPLCPIAVSDAGEIVTARLVLSPRTGVHVRHVPMGVGYRYIGRGLWLDGARSDALLFFGKNRPLSCTVLRG